MIQRPFDARKGGFARLRARNIVTKSLNEFNPEVAGPMGNHGRLLAIDLGSKRVGMAVCDELRISIRPVTTIERRSWKALLSEIREQIEAFEARGLVIGLPLNLDGTEGEAAAETRSIAGKFALSLKVPVYLQDERLTSEEAKSRLAIIQKGAGEIDSAAAALILRDFLEQQAGA
jgi:putative Holliday junction resolvase